MKRFEHENHARFLTFSCYKRLPLFNNDQIKNRFVDQLKSTRDLTGFRLIAWVIMPEHIHLLIWPNSPEYPVSKVTWHLKRNFAKQVITRWRQLDASILDKIQTPDGKLRFWQHGGGYDRNLYTLNEINAKINYIHTNPIRRNLVNQPEEWKWSSARWYAGIKEELLRIDELSSPD